MGQSDRHRLPPELIFESFEFLDTPHTRQLLSVCRQIYANFGKIVKKRQQLEAIFYAELRVRYRTLSENYHNLQNTRHMMLEGAKLLDSDIGQMEKHRFSLYLLDISISLEDQDDLKRARRCYAFILKPVPSVAERIERDLQQYAHLINSSTKPIKKISPMDPVCSLFDKCFPGWLRQYSEKLAEFQELKCQIELQMAKYDQIVAELRQWMAQVDYKRKALQCQAWHRTMRAMRGGTGGERGRTTLAKTDNFGAEYALFTLDGARGCELHPDYPLMYIQQCLADTQKYHDICTMCHDLVKNLKNKKNSAPSCPFCKEPSPPVININVQHFSEQ